MLRRLSLLATVLVVALPGVARADERISPRIVGGGAVSSVGQYPWTVAMEYKSGATWTQFCGGTLIAPTYVVTADHCKLAPGERIRAGSLSRGSGGQQYEVVAVRRHPLSDARRSGAPSRYDVNVVELAAPVTVAGAAPIAVAAPAESALWAAGKALTVTGWGTTTSGGASSSTMKVAQVPRRADASCALSYPDEFFAVDQFCAAPAQGGTDTCQGDSGGPIVAPAVASPRPTAPEDWRLVGATSYGEGCAQAAYPGVYARLSDPDIYEFLDTTAPVAGTATISGPSETGATVTCATTGWTGGRSYRRFRFLRDGAEIVTRRGATYTLTAADAGRVITCQALGDNGAGAAVTAASAPLVPVAPATPDPAPTPAPQPAPAPAPAPTTVTPAPVAATPTAARTTSVAKVRRTCARRRCTFTITSNATSLKVTVRARSGHAQVYRATRRGGAFVVRTGRLRKGRYVATVTGATTTRSLAFNL